MKNNNHFWQSNRWTRWLMDEQCLLPRNTFLLLVNNSSVARKSSQLWTSPVRFRPPRACHVHVSIVSNVIQYVIRGNLDVDIPIHLPQYRRLAGNGNVQFAVKIYIDMTVWHVTTLFVWAAFCKLWSLVVLLFPFLVGIEICSTAILLWHNVIMTSKIIQINMW